MGDSVLSLLLFGSTEALVRCSSRVGSEGCILPVLSGSVQTADRTVDRTRFGLYSISELLFVQLVDTSGLVRGNCQEVRKMNDM